MDMSRLGWACLLACTAACGTTDPTASDPTDSDDEAKVARDAGTGRKDAASDKHDGSSTVDAAAFEQCADTRVDAENKPGAVNVVWVIDTSGSMDQEAALVQQNMNRFVQVMSESGLPDYRVVVVSQKRFITVPDPLGSDSTHFLHIEQNVGSNAPLRQLLDRFGDYKSFLLPDTTTHFIAVTDDNSSVSAQSFVDQMKSDLGDDDFKLDAIASPPGDNSGAIDIFGIPLGTGCKGPNGEAAAEGTVYWDAAKLTNGLTFSICSPDWSALFNDLGKAVSESAAVPCTLELPATPAGQVLDYSRVNVVLTAPGGAGVAVPRAKNKASCADNDGWYYDDESNPTGIELCPASCESAKSGGSLQVALGCASIYL
jgi:hypothetical protein